MAMTNCMRCAACAVGHTLSTSSRSNQAAFKATQHPQQRSSWMSAQIMSCTIKLHHQQSSSASQSHKALTPDTQPLHSTLKLGQLFSMDTSCSAAQHTATCRTCHMGSTQVRHPPQSPLFNTHQAQIQRKPACTSNSAAQHIADCTERHMRKPTGAPPRPHKPLTPHSSLAQMHCKQTCTAHCRQQKVLYG